MHLRGARMQEGRASGIKCVSIRHRAERELMCVVFSLSHFLPPAFHTQVWEHGFPALLWKVSKVLSAQRCTSTHARSGSWPYSLAIGFLYGGSFIFSQPVWLHWRSTVGLVDAARSVSSRVITTSQTGPRSMAEGDCFYCVSQLVGRALDLVLPGTRCFLCYSRRCRRL